MIQAIFTAGAIGNARSQRLAMDLMRTADQMKALGSKSATRSAHRRSQGIIRMCWS